MNRKKRIIRNVIIIVVIYIFITKVNCLFLNPISAFKYAERDYHYGPSKIVHIENNGNSKYILAKYDKCISCCTLSRSLIFWSYYSPIGIENQKEKGINYFWESSLELYRLFGIVNDSRIKKVEVAFSDGKTLVQNKFYDGDMFLFIYKSKAKNWLQIKIRGYDSENNIIFEETI